MIGVVDQERPVGRQGPVRPVLVELGPAGESIVADREVVGGVGSEAALGEVALDPLKVVGRLNTVLDSEIRLAEQKVGFIHQGAAGIFPQELQEAGDGLLVVLAGHRGPAGREGVPQPGGNLDGLVRPGAAGADERKHEDPREDEDARPWRPAARLHFWLE